MNYSSGEGWKPIQSGQKWMTSPIVLLKTSQLLKKIHKMKIFEIKESTRTLFYGFFLPQVKINGRKKYQKSSNEIKTISTSLRVLLNDGSPTELMTKSLYGEVLNRMKLLSVIVNIKRLFFVEFVSNEDINSN